MTTTDAAEILISKLLEELRKVADRLQASISYATKQDLSEMEKRILMNIQDATNALNALSTTADALSVKTDVIVAAIPPYTQKVDKLITDVGALISLVKAGQGGPALDAAIAKAQASSTSAQAEGDKVDAAAASLATAGDNVDTAVASADEVLPQPAPPGNP